MLLVVFHVAYLFSHQILIVLEVVSGALICLFKKKKKNSVDGNLIIPVFDYIYIFFLFFLFK